MEYGLPCIFFNSQLVVINQQVKAAQDSLRTQPEIARNAITAQRALRGVL